MEKEVTLEDIILASFEQLILVEESVASQKPSSDKWSPKQLIGHLIDSASNNHGRFMRAQFQDDMVFPGYDQEGWVESQNYQNANWHDLLILWRQFNLHIGHLIAQIPAEKLAQARTKHNLHQIAWKTVPENETTTLAYFIDDYVNHLQHHLNQIFSLTGISSQ